MKRLNGLTARQFYALIWKDFIVHKRHYVWTLLEITIPVLVCAMAILSNTHQGKPRLENERTFDPDDFERIYGDLNPQRHRLLVAPNSTFTRALVDQIDDGAVYIELCNSESDLIDIIKKEIPISLDQVKRLLPDDSSNVTIGGVVIQSDEELVKQKQKNKRVNHNIRDPNHAHLTSSSSSSWNNVSNFSGERADRLGGKQQKDSYYYYEVISKLDGQLMKIPVQFDMSIRAKDFRLGPEPFPKKYSLGPFLHSDHYTATFFMASQIMLSRAYINLLASYVTNTTTMNNNSNLLSNSTIASAANIVIPTNDDIIGQRMPYPKYVAHKRLKETTLGTFVAGSQKQKPFVLTMDYCVTVGFLVTAIFLSKRIVDEKKSKVRDMLRLVGISDWTYYGSHICNTMIIMIIQCAMITALFTGHQDAPAQNIDSTLLFTILILYCLSSIMFVLALSTFFNSSTKAIIFTSLLWLGLPEILDRIFKMNSGVIESNGFLAVEEHVHLLFCLLPNFGLRLINRLLTECDIYGEFYDKKQLYGEYRAIWPNLTNILPLYKMITLADIMLALLCSIPMYATLIYLINTVGSSSTSGGLANLGESGGGGKSGPGNGLFKLIKLLISLIIAIIVAPLKFVRYILVGSTYSESSHAQAHNNKFDRDNTRSSSNWSAANLNQTSPDVVFNGENNITATKQSGYLKAAYTNGNATTPLPTFKDLAMNKKKIDMELELDNYPPPSPTNLNNEGEQILNCNSMLVKDDATINDQQSILRCEPILSNCTAQNNKKQNGNCSPAPAEGCNDPKYFETAPRILTTGVSIRNLCKTYFTSSSKLRRIDAVRNVTLDMFYSQILVLLGHNGAGKTTLIDIISGHNQKTSGSIHIDGYNIDTHPSEARRRVGFCPQFDVLFERLTVEEHLFFYGIVKGARSELKHEIEELLVQSGLDVHRKKLSKALSGGYKRKLSLAIAMIAKSKVLILDEPTSGMDPESRRKVWDFLQLIRHDRLILMTTHHMEEADALGDRIAVMSSGQVKCCGSALFLKKVFNAGYHLRISKSSNWNQVAFEELIGIKYKLSEKLENLTPHELMYKFDADETGQVLPPLFDDLEKVKERVGIFGFGITVSTMDDVFMKIGIHFKDVEAEEMQSKFELANGLQTNKSSVNKSSNEQNDNNTNGNINGKTKSSQHKLASVIKMNEAKSNNGVNPLSTCKKERVQGSQLFKQHLKALLAKRYHHARKNWFQLLWILSISLACVASIVILIDFVIFKEELTPEWSREMTLEGAGYGLNTQGVYQFAAPSGENSIDLESLRDEAFGFTGSTTSTSTTSTTSTSTTTTTTTTTTTSPPITTLSAAAAAAARTTTLASLVPDTITSSPRDSLPSIASSGEPLTSTTTSTSTPLATTLSVIGTGGETSGTNDGTRRRRRTKRQLNTMIDNKARSLNDSALFLDKYWLTQAKLSGMNNLLTYTDINTQMIDLITRQFADFREHYVIGGEKLGKKYIAWYSGEATHSFPISMNIMLNSILKQFTDLIQDNGHPLKGSRISLRHDAMAQINTLIAFLPHLGRLINLVFLPFSLAFITSYFVIFPTHERVSKSKHLQLMTGVPARTFWLSHFLFDLFLYSTYTISVLAIYFVWDRVINDRRIYFANFEHSVALVALVTLFIFGALPLAYIFSFLAKKPTSAFSSFCVLTILTGTATLTLVSLYELKYEQTASTSFKLAFMVFLWSARLIPSVSLLVGLQKLFALNTTRSICINISPEVLELLCRYINSPLVDDELRVLRPERCCKQVCENECYDQWPFFWSGWFGVNIELAMLVFDACLLWSILVIIESRSLRLKLINSLNAYSPLKWLGYGTTTFSGLLSKARSYCWQVPQFGSNIKDKELQREQLRIEQIIESNNTEQYAMVVNELTKVYETNQFKAVDRLSFVVDKREFFGLLGVNGAGKSTTFKMLTGELRTTSGNSWIGAQDVCQQRRLYLKQIGYCPQQDALIDNMTGVEMLTLFARLRGLPERHIRAAVEDILDKLGLKRIAHIDCTNYSGGNKRRLSVGMALIGAPEVVFLDEPTSGVDPRSRRRLWSTLIEFQQQTKSAIVMTSHSMNECECLCDRVAIMVDGQFKVLGSIQYLRTKLSQGFSLVLKLKPDNLKHMQDLKKTSERIHTYMRDAFSAFKTEIQLKDLHQTIIQYHIQPSVELTWSKMLLLLEKAKEELDLEDYQITSDASLESIFLSLAKKDPVPCNESANKQMAKKNSVNLC